MNDLTTATAAMNETTADTPAVEDRMPRHVSPRLLVEIVAALAVLALVAAHAPPRAKLLGLFPAAVGAAAGGLVATLATQNGVTARRTVLALAAGFVPLTLAGYAAESYRTWRSVRAAEVAENLLAQPGGRVVLDRLRSGGRPESPTEAEFLDAYRFRMNPPVALYLTDRLKGLRVAIPMPWAAVVASWEFLIGCVAGIVTAVIGTRPRNASAEASG